MFEQMDYMNMNPNRLSTLVGSNFKKRGDLFIEEAVVYEDVAS